MASFSESPAATDEKRAGSLSQSYNVSRGGVQLNYGFDAFGSKFNLKLVKNDALVSPRYVPKRRQPNEKSKP